MLSQMGGFKDQVNLRQGRELAIDIFVLHRNCHVAECNLPYVLTLLCLAIQLRRALSVSASSPNVTEFVFPRAGRLYECFQPRCSVLLVIMGVFLFIVFFFLLSNSCQLFRQVCVDATLPSRLKLLFYLFIYFHPAFLIRGFD